MQRGPHDEGKGCAILTVPGCSRTIVFRGPTRPTEASKRMRSFTRSMPASTGNPWFSVGLSTDLKAEALFRSLSVKASGLPKEPRIPRGPSAGCVRAAAASLDPSENFKRVRDLRWR